jgi:hypothetical protein
MVWRDRGEPAVEVHDLWECLEHGTRGGLRTFFVPILAHEYYRDITVVLFSGAGALAFAIRSGVNLILLLTRIRNVPRKTRISLVKHALFGQDSFRLGTMLGLRFLTLVHQ